jgi:hypothetical protein
VAIRIETSKLARFIVVVLVKRPRGNPTRLRVLNHPLRSLAKGHYSAAVWALTVKAKLSGHWIDRTDNKTSNVIYAISDEPLTEEEWAAKYCA